MIRQLKVAQVGVGGFGAARRERMRETGLFKLAAAYDWNEEALARCREQDGAVPVDSYDELLKVPGIEAMIVSTGGKHHAEQVIRAVERGLHVFVEKPLCSTPEEVRAILKAQKKKDVVIGVGHNDHAHDAVSITIRKLIQNGALGAIAAFEKTTAHNGGFHIKPGDWRGDPKKNPGGMLFQCGVHALHELMFYFGPIRKVFSMMRYDVHTTKTADVAVCSLEFESGLIGMLNAYHVTPYRHAFNIFGTKANLYREDLFFDEGTKMWLQATRRDGKKEPKQPVAVAGKTDPCGNLRSFYAAVTRGATPFPSVVDGARAVLAVFAAEASAKAGVAVRIRPI